MADFSGGLASRRIPALRVAFVGQLFGLPVLALGLLVVDGDLTRRGFWWGAVAGAAGGLGIIVFYRAMGDGPMSLVAPITALLTGTVPILAGLAFGERPSILSWVGVLLALVAIVLVTRSPGTISRGGSVPVGHTVARAVLSGVIFGFAFVAFSRPGDAAGLWPLVGARVGSLPLLAVLVVVTGTGLSIPREARQVTIAAGALDMLANIFVLEAFSRGLLALVSVVTSLYPATTLILAHFVLHERVRRDQMLGLVVAAMAVVLISF
jgi:uncharacterized membrane protein